MNFLLLSLLVFAGLASRIDSEVNSTFSAMVRILI